MEGLVDGIRFYMIIKLVAEHEGKQRCPAKCNGRTLVHKENNGHCVEMGGSKRLMKEQNFEMIK